ncbi:hypothetical protein HN51_016383 [Arachis hypogaea]
MSSPSKNSPRSSSLSSSSPISMSSALTRCLELSTHLTDGRASLSSLRFFEKVRILDEEHRISHCEKFLNTFDREGYRIVEMSYEDHNPYTTGSQFITHTVGRILQGLKLESMPINMNYLPLYHATTVRILKPVKLRVRAVDVAQLFNYISKLVKEFTISQLLKIIIVGFSNFRQFFAATLVCQGHTVLAHSRFDHYAVARKLGVSFFQNPDDLSKEHPECLKCNTLFVDVLSVKEFPKKLLLELLPSDFDVLCTHPMFGPKSSPVRWTVLPFIFEKVRTINEEHCVSRHEKFCNAFAREGYSMVKKSCEDHNAYAASLKFIIDTVERIFQGLKLESTPINMNFLPLHHTTIVRTLKPVFELRRNPLLLSRSHCPAGASSPNSVATA